MFLVVCGFLAGVCLTVLMDLIVFDFATKQIADEANKKIEEYKQRWESAVKLLGTEGQLTDEQVQDLLIPEASSPTVLPPMKSTNKAPTDGIVTPSHILSMKSWDRRKLAIDRAKNGLPPNDSLEGMKSWDIVDVERARIKHAKRF